jgi:hypothetical protein
MMQLEAGAVEASVIRATGDARRLPLGQGAPARDPGLATAVGVCLAASLCAEAGVGTRQENILDRTYHRLLAVGSLASSGLSGTVWSSDQIRSMATELPVGS